MSATAAPKLMTAEEYFALPDDGVRRWLIRGQLREARPKEGGEPMTRRNRDHSATMIRVGQHLANWLDAQPEPRGLVVGGEAGVRLRRTPESAVGVDVAYVGPDVAARRDPGTSMIDGAPVLVAEILSPNNTVEEIDEKLDEYLAAGVLVVWVIDPRDRTVTIYRPGARPAMVDDTQELTAEPELPGFRVAVARLFP